MKKIFEVETIGGEFNSSNIRAALSQYWDGSIAVKELPSYNELLKLLHDAREAISNIIDEVPIDSKKELTTFMINSYNSKL